MSNFFLTITFLSGFVYFFGLISLFVKEKLFLSETLASTIFGIIITPNLAEILRNTDKNEMMTQISRIVISLQVVAVGIAVPKTYIRKEWRSLFVILVPIMILTYITSTMIVYWVLNVDFRIALLVGACVTPTDPVLATAVLKGKFASRYIPVHLRNLLTIESGANDGLGFLLLTFPFILKNGSYKKWFLDTWCYEIMFSILIGGFIGYLARKLLFFSKKNNLIDKESFLVSMIALGIFVTGVTGLLKSDDILACFICGMVFAWDQTFLNDVKESHLLEVIDLLVNHVFFIFFGSLISWGDFKWKYLLITVLILIFRRLPFFFMFMKFIPQLKNTKETFFAGWFGPIGVGAVFFSYHAMHELGDMKILGKNEIMPLVQYIVLGSIVVHGMTAPIMNFSLRKKKKSEILEESEYATESNCLFDN